MVLPLRLNESVPPLVVRLFNSNAVPPISGAIEPVLIDTGPFTWPEPAKVPPLIVVVAGVAGEAYNCALFAVAKFPR